MKIKGSIALVTGANRGLGKALVAALVEAGAAKVYAAARDLEKLSAGDARVVPLALDTARPEELSAAVKKAGDVTLLINNAGTLTSYDVLTASQAELDKDFGRRGATSPSALAKSIARSNRSRAWTVLRPSEADTFWRSAGPTG